MQPASARSVNPRLVFAVGAVLLTLTISACDESLSSTSPTSVGSTIAVVSGNHQGGTIGTPLNDPLVVQVNDPSGNPVPNVTVRWKVIDGGGSVSRDLTMTDAAGRAQVIWTLGPTAGDGDVTAAIGALATQTAQFTARAFLGL